MHTRIVNVKIFLVFDRVFVIQVSVTKGKSDIIISNLKVLREKMTLIPISICSTETMEKSEILGRILKIAHLFVWRKFHLIFTYKASE